jgi:hypothetical protein
VLALALLLAACTTPQSTPAPTPALKIVGDERVTEFEGSWYIVFDVYGPGADVIALCSFETKAGPDDPLITQYSQVRLGSLAAGEAVRARCRPGSPGSPQRPPSVRLIPAEEAARMTTPPGGVITIDPGLGY